MAETRPNGSSGQGTVACQGLDGSCAYGVAQQPDLRAEYGRVASAATNEEALDYLANRLAQMTVMAVETPHSGLHAENLGLIASGEYHIAAERYQLKRYHLMVPVEVARHYGIPTWRIRIMLDRAREEDPKAFRDILAAQNAEIRNASAEDKGDLFTEARYANIENAIHGLLASIETVYSDDAGVKECSRFLKRVLPDAEIHKTLCTARAAREVRRIADSRQHEDYPKYMPRVAAIGTVDCESYYSLCVIAPDIQNVGEGHWTRYVEVKRGRRVDLAKLKEEFAAARGEKRDENDVKRMLAEAEWQLIRDLVPDEGDRLRIAALCEDRGFSAKPAEVEEFPAHIRREAGGRLRPELRARLELAAEIIHERNRAAVFEETDRSGRRRPRDVAEPFQATPHVYVKLDFLGRRRDPLGRFIFDPLGRFLDRIGNALDRLLGSGPAPYRGLPTSRGQDEKAVAAAVAAYRRRVLYATGPHLKTALILRADNQDVSPQTLLAPFARHGVHVLSSATLPPSATGTEVPAGVFIEVLGYPAGLVSRQSLTVKGSDPARGDGGPELDREGRAMFSPRHARNRALDHAIGDVLRTGLASVDFAGAYVMRSPLRADELEAERLLDMLRDRKKTRDSYPALSDYASLYVNRETHGEDGKGGGPAAQPAVSGGAGSDDGAATVRPLSGSRRPTSLPTRPARAAE
jgi:hypothetical protein